jgi:SAM-dependent methyltransferase
VPRRFDDSLYSGSAEHYLAGRMRYPQRLATAITDRVRHGRLLDLGCGPGSLTVLLAPAFREVVAVDADADMVRVASAEAERRGQRNITWRVSSAEDLDDVGDLDVVTLAQSFHWMDRPVVAAKMRSWLVPGGWCVHVDARTHVGESSALGLPHPAPPHDEMAALVRRYLGRHRRAGQQTVVTDEPPGGEAVALRGAGFIGPDTVPVPGGDLFVRTEDEVVSTVLSLSSSAPHLFGDRFPEFVADLRALLRDTSPDGRFSEQLQDMSLYFWRNPRLNSTASR